MTKLPNVVVSPDPEGPQGVLVESPGDPTDLVRADDIHVRAEEECPGVQNAPENQSAQEDPMD